MVARRVSHSRPLYLDIADTTAEVGISRRQLGHWQAIGLLKPELGPGAKRYTANDLARLAILKRLIVDHGFPINLVKKVVSNEGSVAAALVKDIVKASGAWRRTEAQVVDLETDRIVPRYELESELWNEYVATAPTDHLEERFYVLALMLFRDIRNSSKTWASFQGRRDELLGQVRESALVARFTWDGRQFGQQPRLAPALPDDPPLGGMELVERFQSVVGDRLQEIEQAAKKVAEGWGYYVRDALWAANIKADIRDEMRSWVQVQDVADGAEDHNQEGRG